MPRPLTATIHLSAMQHNLALVRQRAPASKIWAVVKANAYGHGLERAMRAFASADGLALVEVDYALRLREMGWSKPILLLEGFFHAADLPLLAQHQVQFGVHCKEQIAMIEQVALHSPVDVHLKLNSGMNRLGFTPAELSAAYRRLRAHPAVRSISLMTHLANADDTSNAILPLGAQLECFRGAAGNLTGERSVANSAAVLACPEIVADWVRPGIMLYGATPGAKTAAEYGLRAAMSLQSEIIGIQYLKRGDAVGYGSHFVAAGPTTIGVVACGYADGYPRHAPTGTPMLVDGIKTSTVGRVSMDMLTVDLTGIPHAHVGSKVELWGQQLPIDDVAQAAGTIGYELMCALAQRVAVREDS